jgi:hypothetical protein
VIIYSVEITIDREIETEWLQWMRQVHVPDVLRTGCFISCQIYQVLETEGNEPVYLLQYRCKSLETFHRYRDQFAPAMQKEHSERYAGRFRGSRRILDEVEGLGMEN